MLAFADYALVVDIYADATDFLSARYGKVQVFVNFEYVYVLYVDFFRIYSVWLCFVYQFAEENSVPDTFKQLSTLRV